MNKKSLGKLLMLVFVLPLLLVTFLGENKVEASSGTSLINVAKKYMGTKYVYGGSTPSGFDCSGYVMHVYNEMGVSLPRTTGGQFSSGTAVSKGSLQTGDLVFFANPGGTGRVSHVGIYIGANNFIHASTSRGVMISDINDPYYWGTRYAGAKRVANIASVNQGWKQEGSNWVYYQNGSKATGWKSINGKWYYMNGSGIMQTGWKQLNGKWYYLNGSGAMQTGWNYIGNKWYYMNGSGAMETGWKKLSGTWYYMNGSGAMETGWTYLNDEWYYLNGSGAMETEWNKVNNKWYHHQNSGEMETGWITKNDKTYFLYDSGEMAVNTIIEDVYVVGNDGSIVEILDL